MVRRPRAHRLTRHARRRLRDQRGSEQRADIAIGSKRILAGPRPTPLLLTAERDRDGEAFLPMRRVSPQLPAGRTGFRSSEFAAGSGGQSWEPTSVTAPSISTVLACAIRPGRSIQIGTRASASRSMPLARPHGVFLSAISRTSTPRPLGRTSASTMPEPLVWV
jgi:hypothetical protein